MKVIVHSLPRDIFIDEFADEHGLTMEVRERNKLFWTDGRSVGKYQACFDNAVVIRANPNRDNYCGYGMTIEEAIEEAIVDYIRQIILLTMVIQKDSMSESYIVSVPKLSTKLRMDKIEMKWVVQE